jgi:cytidylate kinase
MKKSDKPAELPNIKNITISGRIGTGKTTLANHLGDTLGWSVLDGGKLFRKITKDLGTNIKETNARPDSFDLAYEENVKKLLREEKNQIIQSHLAGFDAQGIQGVYKILVICRDEEGNDKVDIRIDRLMNRDNIDLEKAKEEIIEREKQNLEKFRRLYASNDQNWLYWDERYYDLVVNTYSHNREEALKFVLAHVGLKSD